MEIEDLLLVIDNIILRFLYNRVVSFLFNLVILITVTFRLDIIKEFIKFLFYNIDLFVVSNYNPFIVRLNVAHRNLTGQTSTDLELNYINVEYGGILYIIGQY